MAEYFSEIPHTRANRAQQIYQILTGFAYERRIATYGQIAEILGYEGAGTLSQILGHIMHWCDQNGLPPLTALVVNADTGLSGEGIGDRDVNAEREKVFGEDWFDIVPPTSKELETANKKGQN